MKLMTAEITRKLPPLYATEKTPIPEKVAVARFFTPDSNWTWYAVEFDPEERRFFGLVQGHEEELGYFTIDQLESVRGRLGLRVERDMHFRSIKLGAVARRPW